MTIELSGRQIFLASPGDLATERALVRSQLQRFNEMDAHEKGVAFLTRGWGDVSGGVGRPQGLINPVLDECDFLILILGDRWGSPPALDGGYSSGTEEEFHRAVSLLSDPNKPMRDLLVLFRTNDSSRLLDPGPQLAKVLEFRALLEAGKEMLFDVFDSPQTLEQRVEKALRKWVVPLSDKIPVQINLGPVAVESSGAEDASVTDLLKLANEFADSGRKIQAELVFAQAVRDRDPEALSEFAKFMRRTGRLQTAMELTTEVLSSPAVLLTNDANAVARRVDAMANIGVIQRKLGDIAASLATLKEAVHTAEMSDFDLPYEYAYALDNLGHSFDANGDLPGANDSFQAALQIRSGLGDANNTGQSHVNLGRVLLRQSEYVSAAKQFERALEVVDRGIAPRVAANALTSRANALSKLGEHDGAVKSLEEALELNQATKNSDGESIVHVALAKAHLARGALADAAAHAKLSLEESDRSGNRSGEANATWTLGLIARASGDHSLESAYFDRAQASAAETNNRGLQAAIARSAAN